MTGWRDDRWSTYKEGDLVAWTEGSGNEVRTQTGVVVEVFPSNVYDSESCVIWTGSNTVHYDIKNLQRLSKSDEAT